MLTGGGAEPFGGVTPQGSADGRFTGCPSFDEAGARLFGAVSYCGVAGCVRTRPGWCWRGGAVRSTGAGWWASALSVAVWARSAHGSARRGGACRHRPPAWFTAVPLPLPHGSLCCGLLGPRCKRLTAPDHPTLRRHGDTWQLASGARDAANQVRARELPGHRKGPQGYLSVHLAGLFRGLLRCQLRLRVRFCCTHNGDHFGQARH